MRPPEPSNSVPFPGRPIARQISCSVARPCELNDASTSQRCKIARNMGPIRKVSQRFDSASSIKASALAGALASRSKGMVAALLSRQPAPPPSTDDDRLMRQETLDLKRVYYAIPANMRGELIALFRFIATAAGS
jgi:hypothetical protein